VLLLTFYERKEKIMAGNPMCKKQGHKMHVCAMKENGFDKKNPSRFKEITANPKYECGTCGGKAKSSENLCNPVKL
jgi:hypothetical protein